MVGEEVVGVEVEEEEGVGGEDEVEEWVGEVVEGVGVGTLSPLFSHVI